MTQNIEISKLRHHPNNPRKEIGDLGELAESIRTQGLICPLLVIPNGDDEFFVIAGNRRLEACKLAGLESVSCEVANLTDEEAIGVMLTENMLRQNLSTIEENEGFQLMLDMGKDEDQIAKKTGLKAETIKMRTKLSKIKKESLQKAVESGATIFELAVVADIENEKEREKILAKAGTKNFNNAVAQYEQEQKKKERMIAIEQYLRDHEFEEYTDYDFEDGFTKLLYKEKDGTITAECGYQKVFCEFNSWEKNMPEDSMFDPECKYRFTKTSWGIKVYTDVTAEEYEKRKADRAEDDRKTKEREALQAVVSSINQRHEQLREDFVLNYSDFKKHQKELKNLAIDAFDNLFDTDTRIWGMKENLNKLIDKMPEDTKANMADKVLLLRAYVALNQYSFFSMAWNGGKSVPVFRENASLRKLYNGLVSLGYQLSDEEEQVMNGTHPLFFKEEPPVVEEEEATEEELAEYDEEDEEIAS